MKVFAWGNLFRHLNYFKGIGDIFPTILISLLLNVCGVIVIDTFSKYNKKYKEYEHYINLESSTYKNKIEFPENE